MPRIFSFAVFLYLVLKLCRLMVSPATGNRVSEATWRNVLRAGEPILFIGIFGFAAMIAVYTNWWGKIFAEGQYAYSTDCYARIAASRHLPDLPARFGSYEAAQAARGNLDFAVIHGSQLGVSRDAVDRHLEQARIAYAEHYTVLAARNDGPGIAASFNGLDRCLKGEGAPRGELLRPNV